MRQESTSVAFSGLAEYPPQRIVEIVDPRNAQTPSAHNRLSISGAANCSVSKWSPVAESRKVQEIEENAVALRKVCPTMTLNFVKESGLVAVPLEPRRRESP